MPPARPRLELLGSEAEPGRTPADAPQGGGRRRPRWGLLALAAALILSLAALAVQTRRTAALSERVEGLAAELSASRLALEAHRSHLDDVRASVAELQELVSRQPGAPPPPEPR